MRYFPVIQEWLEPQYKLIAQPPPEYDPGDTANREGTFAFAIEILYQLGKCSSEEYLFVKNRYRKVLRLLEDPNNPGLIRRYPDPKYWGGLSDRLSRDQCIPNVIAMGFMDRTFLKKFFLAHLKRGLLFTTNTRRNWAWPPGHPEHDPEQYKWKMPDITLFGFWALYIRAFNVKALYPLLCIFDLYMALNSLVKVFHYSKDPKNADDMNHFLPMYQAEMVMPTLFSKLAKWIYKFRKYPSPTSRPQPSNPAQACMDLYFRGPIPGPKLEEIYEEVNEYFS